jgi:SAM-dependent methyltransferase
MEEAEQARAYAQADFSRAHQAVVTLFQRRFGNVTGIAREALDLGCGPGDVTLRFARAYPELRWLGIDGSEAMLSEGRQAVAAAGLARQIPAGQITLERRFLPDATLPEAAFDVVVSNSLLHHLADPAVLWQSVRHTARPGAPVLVVDLRRAESPAAARALTAEHAAGAPGVLARDFYNSLLAAYTVEELEQQLAAAGLGSLHVESTDAIHLAVWGHAPAR